MIERRAVLGLCLAISTPLVVSVVAAAAAATPGYDSWSDTVSRLASPSQPWSPFVRAAMVAYGLLMVLAAPSIARWSGGGRLQGGAIVVGGAGVLLAGVACKDLPRTPDSAESAVHVVAAVSAGCALTFGMATSVVRRRTVRLACLSAGAVAVTVVAAAVFPFAWGSAYYGALERLILLGPMLWLSGAGAALALGDQVKRPSPIASATNSASSPSSA